MGCSPPRAWGALTPGTTHKQLTREGWGVDKNHGDLEAMLDEGGKYGVGVGWGWGAGPLSLLPSPSAGPKCSLGHLGLLGAGTELGIVWAAGAQKPKGRALWAWCGAEPGVCRSC